MRLIVNQSKDLCGVIEESNDICLPGDKSISHRASLFAGIANGESVIRNFLVSGVTRAMLEALSALGVDWSMDGTSLYVTGKGIEGFHDPQSVIQCGNSATTIRLLAGILAASGVEAVLDGSEGLRRRPMERIVKPLQLMGVPISSSEEGTAPLSIQSRCNGDSLNPINYTLPVASAQVKTCLMLAALSAPGETVLREPGPSRDHTERMLRGMGLDISQNIVEEPDGVLFETRMVIPESGLQLNPLLINLPGDISSAAFLIVAALIVPGSDIVLKGVGVNPTRTGLLDALISMGAKITLSNHNERAGEPVADIRVCHSLLKGTNINGDDVVRMIDEFPIFAVAASYAKGDTVVSEALELRHKESDRIKAICTELSRLGVNIEEMPDGFVLHGNGSVQGGVITNSYGDHRLAMSMTVAGLASNETVIVDQAEIIHESFPMFTRTLVELGANLRPEDGNF